MRDFSGFSRGMRVPLVALALAIALAMGLFVLSPASHAQPRVTTPPACCAITAIEANTGMVTARDSQSGRTFQFRMTDRALLGGLRVGQPVYADFATNRAGLAAGTYCCGIVTAAAAPPGITTQAVPPSVYTPKTKFDPKAHGFEFTNYFTGEILVDIPGIGNVNLGNSTYGLCGGMVFAAFDTFNLGAVAPDVPTTPPASGTPMRSYIYGRQMDSLKADNWFLVQKLIKWMRKPLNDNTVPNPLAQGGVNVIERGLIHLSGKQFSDKIRPELDAGRPVTIVLVKASGEDMVTNPKAAFSKNHQVLAISYSRHGNEWDIDIYDPNHPNTIQTLHVDGRYQTLKGSTTRTGGFRGFFRAPYKVERPPWVPDNPTVAGRIKSYPAVSLGRPDADD